MKTYKRAKPRTKRGGEKELFGELLPFENCHCATNFQVENTRGNFFDTVGKYGSPGLKPLPYIPPTGDTNTLRETNGPDPSLAKFDLGAQGNETKHDKISSHKDDGFDPSMADFDWNAQDNETKPGNIEKGHVSQKISKYNALYIMLFQRGDDNDHITYILPELFVLFELFDGTIDDLNEFYYKDFLTVKTNTIKKLPLKVTSLKKRNKLDHIRSTRPANYCRSNKKTIYSCNRMDKLAALFMHCGNRLNELALWYHGIQYGQQNINRLFENSISPIDKLIDFFHQSMITVAGTKPNPFILKKFYKLVKYNIKTVLLKMTLYVMIRSVERMIVIERMKYGTMKSGNYVLPYYLQKLQNFRKSIIAWELKKDSSY